jgi:hypothetical protein
MPPLWPLANFAWNFRSLMGRRAKKPTAHDRSAIFENAENTIHRARARPIVDPRDFRLRTIQQLMPLSKAEPLTARSLLISARSYGAPTADAQIVEGFLFRTFQNCPKDSIRPQKIR